jgi:hypothetical protein
MAKKKARLKPSPKPRKVTAVVAVPHVPEAVEVAVVLPVPLREEPDVTWQAKGKRLYITIRDFVT